DQAIVELINIIFASGRRSLESLLLAYATTDRISVPMADQLIQEAGDGIIRLLGQRRRLDTRNALAQNTPPAYVVRYLNAIANLNGRQPNGFLNDVINHLANCGCVVSSVVRIQNLCLMLPSGSFYQCPDCR